MSSFRRRLMMAAFAGGGGGYIQFADPVVEQICATNWGDGVGITPAQAAAVTSNQFGTTFQNNTQITSFDELQYFTGVTSIPDSAFKGCSSLESVSLPNGLSSIGSTAFQGCPALSTIHIGTVPSTLSWGGDVWYATNNVTKVYVPTFEDWLNFNVNTPIGSDGWYRGNPMNSNGHLFVNGNELISATIPNSVTVLSGRLFRGLVNLQSVSIPSSITTIGISCFSGCTNLVLDVTNLFRSVTAIYANAFLNATNVYGTLTLPSLTTILTSMFSGTSISAINELGGILSVTDGAFRYMQLTSVRLPQSVTSIGYDSFYSTTQMSELVVLAATPPTLNQYAFGIFPQKVYVPYSADHSVLAAYQSASVWSTYASRIYELDQNGNIPT